MKFHASRDYISCSMHFPHSCYLLIFLLMHAAGAECPNIELINADDLGWMEVGCHGQKKIKNRISIDWLPKASDGYTSIPVLGLLPRPATSC